MHRATIQSRLVRLKILADAVNVPDDFTMSYENDDYKHRFKTFKENLDNMEFSIKILLNGDRYWFKYYNEWYTALSKVYLKENE